MSTSTPHLPTDLPPLDVPVQHLCRITVEQYHQMIANGLFGDDQNIELLEGWLVRKMNKNPPHSYATQQLFLVLSRLLPGGWTVRSQDALTTVDSEPEPDACVLRGTPRDYRERHPSAADIGIVVEVADSSLSRDRGMKKRLYARAGIPQYWIVNLSQRLVEVYSEPVASAAQPDYAQRREYRAPEAIPVVLDGVEVGTIRVEEILP